MKKLSLLEAAVLNMQVISSAGNWLSRNACSHVLAGPIQWQLYTLKYSGIKCTWIQYTGHRPLTVHSQQCRGGSMGGGEG